MRRAALILLVSLSALTLAACAPINVSVDPTPTALAAVPPFASEEEALEAAAGTVTQFYDLGALILAEGGVDGERLGEFATPSVVAIEMTGFDELREKQLTYRGQTVMRSVTLQSYLPDAADGRGVVTAYVCADGTGVTIDYPNGDSYLSPDRQGGVPFEITFDVATRNPTTLVVSSKLYWEGAGIC